MSVTAKVAADATLSPIDFATINHTDHLAMFIVKHKNRRSDKDRNPFFYRIGGHSQTDTAGAIVNDLETAADVMEGVHADLIKMSHATEVAKLVAKRTAKAAARPTLWSQYARPALNPARSEPLAETVAVSLLERRSTDRFMAVA